MQGSKIKAIGFFCALSNHILSFLPSAVFAQSAVQQKRGFVSPAEARGLMPLMGNTKHKNDLQSIAEIIREELSEIVYPPPATPVEMIMVQPGQMVVQVPV